MQYFSVTDWWISLFVLTTYWQNSWVFFPCVPWKFLRFCFMSFLQIFQYFPWPTDEFRVFVLDQLTNFVIFSHDRLSNFVIFSHNWLANFSTYMNCTGLQKSLLRKDFFFFIMELYLISKDFAGLVLNCLVKKILLCGI